MIHTDEIVLHQTVSLAFGVAHARNDGVVDTRESHVHGMTGKQHAGRTILNDFIAVGKDALPVELEGLDGGGGKAKSAGKQHGELHSGVPKDKNRKLKKRFQKKRK
ncbi:branched-chain amino acid ABC transporter ATP-binding protein/permease [Babesia caballi]|uniref:Branched-chain amino acid ABC transporter ATP-binding protein/permease n=1 Tax=Babesia caballi TaxID=5871 RepID=A0AAV4M1X2_BABCB|nr:branched-chain amino acid ABC transporter ATP-binding protein/permease [Babesia caballi]